MEKSRPLRPRGLGQASSEAVPRLCSLHAHVRLHLLHVLLITFQPSFTSTMDKMERFNSGVAHELQAHHCEDVLSHDGDGILAFQPKSQASH